MTASQLFARDRGKKQDAGVTNKSRGAQNRIDVWSVWTGRAVWALFALLAIVVSRNAWQAFGRYERVRAIRCDRPVYEFGRAFVGDILEHTFRVKNVGAHPMHIVRVRAECGCTTLGENVEGKTIEPEQTLDLPVKLTLSGAELGRLERKLIVEFSDSPSVRVALKIQGTIDRRWSWTPAGLVFDNISRYDVVSKTITLLESARGSPQAIEHVATSTETLKAVLSSRGGRDVIIVSTVPPLSLGRQEAAVYFYVANGENPFGPIPVTLFVNE